MPEPVGFFTDTTVCIGCKACQVACHQWNDLPAEPGPNNGLPVLSGDSYDNTRSFSDVNCAIDVTEKNVARLQAIPFLVALAQFSIADFIQIKTCI